MGIPLESWPAFVEEVYRVLKPETGWAAFLEMDTRLRSDDGSLPVDSDYLQVDFQNMAGANFELQQSVGDFSSTKGIAVDVGPVHLENFVRSQPFVDVQVESVKMPHGLWPEGTLLEKLSDPSDLRGKSIGWYSLGVYGKGVDSMAPAI